MIYSKLYKKVGDFMFGFKKCDSCKEDDINDLNKFKLKIENEKIKIHAKYIAFISLGIVIYLISTGTANNPEFSGWISFASTLTSIVLSVIAIILSITGEGKTDALRNEMEETAYKLDKAVGEFIGANKEIKENLADLNDSVAMLKNNIDQMESHMDSIHQEMRQYAKEKTSSDNVDMEINRNVEWWKDDEELEF